MGYPQIIHFSGIFQINPPFWGSPILGHLHILFGVTILVESFLHPPLYKIHRAGVDIRSHSCQLGHPYKVPPLNCNYLVGGLVAIWIIFPIYWEFHHPN